MEQLENITEENIVSEDRPSVGVCDTKSHSEIMLEDENIFVKQSGVCDSKPVYATRLAQIN